MKCLIVNADDLGADEARNAGIFEGIEAGLVTACSILPNGPAREDAWRRIRACRDRTVSWGVHCNLSEGRPLVSGLRHITDAAGAFCGKSGARRLLQRRGVPEDEIRRELQAQVRILLDAGIPIDHMDGHQHLHVWPAVAAIAAEVAQDHGICWVRIPEESAGGPWMPPPADPVRKEIESFNRNARMARPVYGRAGLQTPEGFRGLFFKGNLPAAHWREFLESLPDGLTELMVHPGHAAGPDCAGPFSRFSTSDRERELEFLTDGRLVAALRHADVRLTPFPSVSPRGMGAPVLHT